MNVDKPFPVEIDELQAQMDAFEEACVKRGMEAPVRDPHVFLKRDWSDAYTTQDASDRFVGWVMSAVQAKRRALPDAGSSEDLLRWCRIYERGLASSSLLNRDEDPAVAEHVRDTLADLRNTIQIAESLIRAARP